MLRKLISYQSYLKRTCSMRKIAILLAVLLFALSTPLMADIRGTDINGKPVILRSDGTWSYISGGDAKICQAYANKAIAQQRENQRRGCGFAGVRWHLDYNKHYNGCMGSAAQWPVRETNLRQNALSTCSKTGGKAKICQAYANNAIAQQRENQRRGCGFAGGLWHLDYKTHHKWCMSVSVQARGKATNDRRNALNICSSKGGSGRIGGLWSSNFGDIRFPNISGGSLRAPYTNAGGRIIGGLNGRRLTGIWVQNTSPKRCNPARDGSYHWGRMEFTFNQKLNEFNGIWGYCEDLPTAEWKGKKK